MTNKTILLVEDNPDDVELTLHALRKHNVVNKVTVVHDGQEALDWIFGAGPHAGRDTSVMPVMVLLDLNLPKVGGLEVLARVRADERTRVLPIIILTSSREEQDRIAAYRNGANSYVTKPVDFVEFTRAVEQLSLYWLVLNEPPPTL